MQGDVQLSHLTGELLLLHFDGLLEGDFIEGAVPAGGRLWIATSGDGLYGVSLDGVGEPTHIGMAEGLPSDVIHSVAAVGDTLYFGCG